MALAVSVMATATGTASANPRVKGEGEVRRAPNVADPSAFSILKWGKNEIEKEKILLLCLRVEFKTEPCSPTRPKGKNVTLCLPKIGIAQGETER